MIDPGLQKLLAVGLVCVLGVAWILVRLYELDQRCPLGWRGSGHDHSDGACRCGKMPPR